ncbi:hypothetical protein F5Y16DRAFT_421142 [Xylariaceae sp. FL0255]|nr:hypothetical protein F5Y16DRAFT_421142 [Xylariaceae sp. FL0255]
MASWAVKETLHRVASQPGATPKRWDKAELIRCGAVGTNFATKPDLNGDVHPVFTNWTRTESELRSELEQPILLASKLIEAAGLPWLSDFNIDDIFDDLYPGRNKIHSHYFGQFDRTVIPQSIVRHHRAPWASDDHKRQWKDSTRALLKVDMPGLIHWQLDREIFPKNGWNGYTCRHPRGDLPLSELDKYETIEKFDSICLHERYRSLTILLTSEFPARLAELRRQGKADGEEYLLTAFMTTVTILHELGHAIYWKDRRSLTRGLREPFYGADLEMELGDSFVAAIFGGWVPVPVRELSSLREYFSFKDGLAWRQALSWDYHRTRPKYRACYSIPVDYIAKLFSQKSWSQPSEVTTMIRPQLLTGESAALRTVGMYTLLSRTNRHATAAVADFHCQGEEWVWNRRLGACFRIPQFAGAVYPDIELPTATEDVVCEPHARDLRHIRRLTPNPIFHTSKAYSKLEASQNEINIRGDARVAKPEGEARREAIKLSPRKSEYSPRKFVLVTPTKIPRPSSSPGSSPGSSRFSLTASPRKRGDSGAKSSASSSLANNEHQQIQRRTHAAKQQGPGSVAGRGVERSDPQHREEEDDIPCVRLRAAPERSEISVDELKQRLSQLIGVSLTEMEKMFDAPLLSGESDVREAIN